MSLQEFASLFASSKIELDVELANLANPQITETLLQHRSLGRRCGTVARKSFPSRLMVRTIGYMQPHPSHSPVSSARLMSTCHGAELNYRIFTDQDGDSVSLSLVFLGTGEGVLWRQLLTDFDTRSTDMSLKLDGVTYELDVYRGIYMSLFDSNAHQAMLIIADLDRIRRKHPASKNASTKWKLCLGGYSLGASQLLTFLMWYMSDATQSTNKRLSATAFATLDVFMIGDISGTRRVETQEYAEAIQVKYTTLHIFSCIHSFDLASRLFFGFPLSRRVLSHYYVITDDAYCEIYRIPSGLIGRSVIWSSMIAISYVDVRSLMFLSTLTRYCLSQHLILSYKNNIQYFADCKMNAVANKKVALSPLGRKEYKKRR
jgi:hypothetical protein